MRVALLHGFAGDPSVWDDVELAGEIERVAIALPGHVRACDVARDWEANLDLVARAIAGCELAIGYSLGARVALGLVARGAIQRAILISVNPGIDDGERAARRASDAAWTRVLRDDGIAAFADRWSAQPLFATQSRAEPARLARRRAARLARDPEQLARSLEAMGLAEMPDYRAAFPADRVALVAGADDAKFAAIARSLAACGAPLELLAGCGHDPTLEQPRALGAAISRLL